MVGRESINYRRGRSGRPFERDKARVYATETHCVICGKLVNKALPYRDPITNKVNVWSKSYEHPTELDAGGQPYGGHLAHLTCNSRKGQAYKTAKANRQRGRGGPLRSSPDLD